jgi:hypothetical protein
LWQGVLIVSTRHEEIQDSTGAVMSTRKIGFLMAAIAAAATLGTACGHSAGNGARPDPASSSGSSGAGAAPGPALPEPCTLVPSAEVQAGLGLPVTSAKKPYDNFCTYSHAGVPVLTIAVFPAPYIADGPYFSGKSAPVNGLGHPADCGPSSSGPSNLIGAIGSDETLGIIGPSCAADKIFALDMYSRLGS